MGSAEYEMPASDAIGAGPLDVHHLAPWPYQQLNPGLLRETGWRPAALQAFVLKIHQTCNLACDYCYVYNMADQSWRTKPKIMSPTVWSATAKRISEHAEVHGLDEIQIILHGGEPLLAGPTRIAAVTATIRKALHPATKARFAVQTNGTLLDHVMLRTLVNSGIGIGVSLDGSPNVQNRHRTHADGRGSFSEVDQGLRRLASPQYRNAFSGILAVIDPISDPIATYEMLLKYAPPRLDFVLPHASWSAPPRVGQTGTALYGDWLIRLFDRWYDAPCQETGIRFFEEIIHVVLGGKDRCEDLGQGPATVVTIDSDGAIEQADALKSAYPGAAHTGLSVLADNFDAVLTHPGFIARQIGFEALSDACRACELQSICGGGQYAHRYRAGFGFRNPSVYCQDLAAIITHIRDRILIDL